MDAKCGMVALKECVTGPGACVCVCLILAVWFWACNSRCVFGPMATSPICDIAAVNAGLLVSTSVTTMTRYQVRSRACWSSFSCPAPGTSVQPTGRTYAVHSQQEHGSECEHRRLHGVHNHFTFSKVDLLSSIGNLTDTKIELAPLKRVPSVAGLISGYAWL